MPVLQSVEIWHRDDFPVLCNWRKLWRAVEVGVDRAEFATMFLERWQGNEYYGIDAYKPYGEFRLGGMPFDRHADFETAIQRLSKHAGRGKLIRLSSVQASGIFADQSVGFIYIDGAHDHKSVAADLAAWWPKVQPGGILAGHDWTDQEAHAGVKQAVTEFAERIGETVYITTVEGYNEETCPSWYLYRGGLPGPEWRRC